MRRSLFAIALIALIATATVGAQIVPSIDYASREYGVSGSYSRKSEVTGTGHVSDLNGLAYWGIHLGMLGLQVEGEYGYARHRSDLADSLSTEWTLGGNGIINVPLLWDISAFGLVGGGFDRIAIDPAGANNRGVMKKGFYQYGGGVKIMMVPNAGLRVEYRRRVRGGDANVTPKSTDLVLFGISIFQ